MNAAAAPFKANNNFGGSDDIEDDIDGYAPVGQGAGSDDDDDLDYEDDDFDEEEEE